MRVLKVNYPRLFQGLAQKPEAYRVLADNYEWEKRTVEQHIEGRRYDEFNLFLEEVIGEARGQVIVECGCGFGGNLIPFRKRNKCIGVDFSRTALKKLRAHTGGIDLIGADISAVPLQNSCADYVIFARVLFVYEDLETIGRMLREAWRILRPGGKVVIINDYCSLGVRVFTAVRDWARSVLKRVGRVQAEPREFMYYYFEIDDMRMLLGRAGLTATRFWLCNVHQGVYHVTYHNSILGLVLRNHTLHRQVRHKDHWERVRLSENINDAYPLNWLGRFISQKICRLFPSLAALSLCSLAEKGSDGIAGSG